MLEGMRIDGGGQVRGFNGVVLGNYVGDRRYMVGRSLTSQGELYDDFRGLCGVVELKPQPKGSALVSSQSSGCRKFSELRYGGTTSSSQNGYYEPPTAPYPTLFMNHTHLYFLAEKYDIDTLRALALKKLHQCLCYFPLHDDSYDDIIDFVLYVYENTLTRAKMDPLREMITKYLAEKAQCVVYSPQGKMLIKVGGDLAIEVMMMVLEYSQAKEKVTPPKRNPPVRRNSAQWFGSDRGPWVTQDRWA